MLINSIYSYICFVLGIANGYYAIKYHKLINIIAFIFCFIGAIYNLSVGVL